MGHESHVVTRSQANGALNKKFNECSVLETDRLFPFRCWLRCDDSQRCWCGGYRSRRMASLPLARSSKGGPGPRVVVEVRVVVGVGGASHPLARSSTGGPGPKRLSQMWE